MTPPRQLSRQLIRYLEIKPAEIQTHVETHLEDGILESTMGLTNGPEDEPVEGKKFLVRVTSRDTGRKFDIKKSNATVTNLISNCLKVKFTIV